MSRTLFEKYGGFSTIANLVSKFYDRVTEDEQLQPYFEKVDMAKLIQHQTDFIGMIMGAPANQYTGRSLSESHKRLRIEPEHFALTAKHLEDTLIEGGVENQDVATLMGALAKTRKDIVKD